MKFVHLFIALFVFAAQSFAQDTYLLRNQFKQGKEVYYKAALGSEGVTRAAGAERETANTIHVLMAFHTDTVTESGKANLSMKILDLDMENPLSTSGTKPNLKKLLGLGDTPLRLTLDPLGRVIHSPSLSGNVNGPGSGANQLTEQIPWLFCPEEEVKSGDSWHQSREVPMTGASKPIIANTTYTLDSVEEEEGKTIAVIKTVTEISEKDIEVDPFKNQQAGANLVFNFTFKNYDLRTEGTIRFNMDDGHIISKEEEGTMVQEMETDMNIDGADFPSNVVNSFALTTVAEYMESLPEQEEKASTPDSSNE